MSMQLRSMAIASLESFVTFMKTYAAGNALKGGGWDSYREEHHLVIPMLNLRLKCSNNTVEFQPPLEECREIIRSCMEVKGLGLAASVTNSRRVSGILLPHSAMF